MSNATAGAAILLFDSIESAGNLLSSIGLLRVILWVAVAGIQVGQMMLAMVLTPDHVWVKVSLNYRLFLATIIFFQAATISDRLKYVLNYWKQKTHEKEKDNNNNNSNLVNPFCTNPAWILSYHSSRWWTSYPCNCSPWAKVGVAWKNVANLSKIRRWRRGGGERRRGNEKLSTCKNPGQHLFLSPRDVSSEERLCVKPNPVQKQPYFDFAK